MSTSKFVPFKEANSYIGDAHALTSKFVDDGYLFFRDLLDKRRVGTVRDNIISVLKKHEFVDRDAHSDPIWSGKWPETNELSPDGVVTKDVVDLGLLKALAIAPELIELLERVLGGEVFCWADNKGRLRLMLSGEKSMQVADGPKFSFTTPPHQDYYFFRPVEFCTVWIPLMDIDASIGGLAVGRDSHKEGLHEVWWKGKDYLGVAENAEQAQVWRKEGGVVVAGTTKPKDTDRVWLRSDYQLGDVLIFHPLMMHTGVANTSNKVRISTDFRYQRKGTQTNWESHTPMVESSEYFGQIFARLDELGVKTGVYEKVWETMRLEGPSEKVDYDVSKRVKEMVEQMSASD